MRISNIVLASFVIASACGCRCVTAIEQWKCNNLGMCHFGTTPQYTPPPIPYAYPANTTLPAAVGTGAALPAYPQPAVTYQQPYSSQPTTVYPAPAMTYSQPSGAAPAQCQK